MNFDDGMDWLDDVETPVVDPQDEALDGAASAARLLLYNVVRSTFDELASETGLTRRELADRIKASPALVSRLLVRPSNMTIETAGRLMFAMGRDLRVSSRSHCKTAATATADCQNKSFGYLRAFSSTNNIYAVGKMTISERHASCTFYDSGNVRMLQVSGSGTQADGLYEQYAPAQVQANIVWKEAVNA